MSKPTATFEDLEPILSTFSDDPEMRDLVEMFVEDAPFKIQSFLTALQRSDLQRVRVLAHQLKGSAAGYGFACVTDAAGELELMLERHPEDLQTVNRCSAEVIQMLARLKIA